MERTGIKKEEGRESGKEIIERERDSARDGRNLKIKGESVGGV